MRKVVSAAIVRLSVIDMAEHRSTRDEWLRELNTAYLEYVWREMVSGELMSEKENEQ